MTPYVAAENRGDVFLMPTWATGGFFVRNTRKAEFVCLERACAILRDANRLGDSEVFVDVGAHIGTSVIPALTRHGFARAIAIEPDPGNVRVLRANLALNGLHEQVAVVPAALSNSPGQLWFVPGRERGGWAKGRLRDEPAPDAEPVDVVTLDSLAEAGTVDPAATGLLWMGKGFKEEAFLTATLTFLKHRVPTVFVLRRDWMTGSSPLLQELKKNGYAQVIDLRRPSLNEPLSDWPRSLEPIDNLPTISPRKSITDVLVF
jgi:FkbM family methyltransferase